MNAFLPRGWGRLLAGTVLALGAGLAHLHAADIKIEFIPPPMEGTISLGIYDSAGKLVRVLRKEAETSAFTVALNGLIARWDGLDDAGAPCPPGKYHARGYTVGELEVEGVDFIGNDWVGEDDSPRIRRIAAIATGTDGAPLIRATVPGEAQEKIFAVSCQPPEPPEDEPDVRLAPRPDGTPFPAAGNPVRDGVFQPAGVSQSADAARGMNGAVWVIDGGAIKKFAADGALLLTVPPTPGDPPPVKLAASQVSDAVYILGQNDAVQRFTALESTGTAARVRYSEEIRFSDSLEQVAPLLAFPGGKPFVSATALPVALVANPLFQDKPGSVRIRIAKDATGTYLATADGLPLDHISETPHLQWAAMGRPPGSKTVTVFESDGAVVAQFSVSRLANMMAFDAGSFELTASAATPTPAPTAAPAP